MLQKTTHAEHLIALRRIEGQIKGIQKMIEQKRYCIDILTQMHSIIGALYRVENEILKKHIDGCVASALKGTSALEKQEKINEVVELVSKFRKA